MAIHPPEYSELYVVSDIHMGGERGDGKDFQVFNRGKRLAAFVDHIASLRPDSDIALVLNGDIIDSLAEDSVAGYVALDESTALRMMDRICNDASFRPVWDALAAFVQTPRRHLVFIVGNHDIELSLPIVENWIHHRLAPDGGEARFRVLFSTHGAGFTCRVGAARVFCSHGNEVDDWNWVDYNLLGQLGNAINGGRAVKSSDWKPNAGTRLVVDVMNIIKRHYPFVDLLKPEHAAVASVLLALDREVFSKIELSDAFPVVRDKVRGRLVTRNLLSAGASDLSSVPSEAVADEIAQTLLGPDFREAIGEERKKRVGQTEDELLLAAAEAIADGKGAIGALEAEDGQQTLGSWDLFAGWVGLVSREEGVRRALADWLADDTTFEIDAKDLVFERMSDRVSNQVHFVVTGHTHLARALPLGNGRYYYNCGTWIRLLRLTEEAIGDPKIFEDRVWPILKAGRMSVLDDAEIPSRNGDVPLLFDRTNAVRISADGDVVKGDLLRVTDGAAEGKVVLELEPMSTSFEVR